VAGNARVMRRLQPPSWRSLCPSAAAECTCWVAQGRDALCIASIGDQMRGFVD